MAKKTAEDKMEAVDEAPAAEQVAEQPAPLAEAVPAPAAEPVAETPAPVLKHLHDLAKAHGQMIRVVVGGDVPYSAAHLAAEVSHGWARHKHFTGEEVLLTDEDYKAAIEAAKVGKVHPAANKRGA